MIRRAIVSTTKRLFQGFMPLTRAVSCNGWNVSVMPNSCDAERRTLPTSVAVTEPDLHPIVFEALPLQSRSDLGKCLLDASRKQAIHLRPAIVFQGIPICGSLDGPQFLVILDIGISGALG